MAAVDLGKQVGPLPLGAWVAVVGAGLGIAVYTRRQSGTSEPTVVDDTSGVPGVGTGGSGLWTDITTPTTGTSTTPTTYTDNESWGSAAINRLIAANYSPAQVYSAITKALAGGSGENKLSVQEYAVWSQALTFLGAPPTPITIPSPTTTPTPSKFKMTWMSSRVERSGETLRIKQTRFANEAKAANLWNPTTAQLHSTIMQAGIRSGVGVDVVLKTGRWIVVYRMVPA